jgi:AcrR family transcriptional regulator
MKIESDARRAYTKRARADAERENGEAILDAARNAFLADAFDRVTLNRIAEESGVTVQTVIRRFGSKEALFQAFVQRERPRILEDRESDPEAGIDAAIGKLVGHYERDGDIILNFALQEHRIPAIGAIVDEGRATHRTWVETHCRHILSGIRGDARERVIAAAIAATDLSTWKLLRRDLGYSRDVVVSVMRELIAGIESRNS